MPLLPVFAKSANFAETTHNLELNIRTTILCLLVFAAMFSPFVTSASRYSDKDVEGLLKELDRELVMRDYYKERRLARIDSLKKARSADAADQGRWLDMTMKVAIEYNAFNNDSALVYYTNGLDRAVRLGCDTVAAEFRARRATYLSLSGYMSDALNEIAQIDTADMSERLKTVYYMATRQMYSYMGYYYEGFESTSDYWNNRSIQAQKRLLDLLDRDTPEYRLNLGEYYFNCREYTRGRNVLAELVAEIDSETSVHAIACHILASIAKGRGDRNEYLYYLAKSAITDLRRATLEVVSLQELGGVLFEMGQSGRAHEYLMAAMKNAVESRAAVRMMQTTELLNVVESDHLAQIERWRMSTNVIMAILILSLLALLVTIVYLRRQLRRVQALQASLLEAGRTKDVYLSRFMALSSIYMDKLKQFCKLANRKITAGQTDELLKMVKSPKFIDEQSREFYSVFDDAFLHLYPDFVEKINLLLRPDQQIVLAEGELMNSDLRILAFMRLGIDDANRVAQILNFSVNTVYAYRNRLRNRAINRDTFEADILRIGNM